MTPDTSPDIARLRTPRMVLIERSSELARFLLVAINEALERCGLPESTSESRGR